MNSKLINFIKEKFWLNQALFLIASSFMAYCYPVACIKGIIAFCIAQAIIYQSVKLSEDNKSLMSKYFLGFCISFLVAILIYEYFYGVTVFIDGV